MAHGPNNARRVAVPAAVLGAALAVVPAGRADETVALGEGRAYTRSHEASERFTYTFTALESHAYLVTLAQQDFDFVLTVESPDGETRAYNSPLKRDGRELVLIEDAAAGEYAVTVHTDEHTAARAGHSIELADVTLAGDTVREAWALVTRGAAANHESGQQAWTEAVRAYEAAAQRWHALERPRERAHALYAVAAIEYWNRYEWQRSADFARSAARVYDGLDRAALRANALHLRAAALVERALEASASDTAEPLFDDAFELLEQARRVHERLGNVYDLGLVLNNFGYTHFNRGEFERARSYWERAAALMRDADELSGELNPISNLAGLDAEQGNVASAIESFERVLEILPSGELMRYRAGTLDNLGISHLMFGNVEQALQAFSRALEIQRGIDDRQGQGRTLRGMGSTYHSLGELEVARTYLSRALEIARETNDGRNRESILRTLGNIAYLEHDYESAVDLHRRALDIAASKSDRAYLRLLIAKDLTALGRVAEAGELTETARATAEQRDSELLLAEALHEAGRAALREADGGRAVDALERAAGIYERLDLEPQHAEVLHSLAVAARDRGRLEQAVDYGAAALERLERLRLRVAAPELRAYYSAARRDYYESQVEFLMALRGPAPGSEANRATAALETSERARARMIADLLQEASIELELDAPASVRQRRSELHDRLAERSRQREIVLEGGVEGADAQQRLESLSAEIASIENELNLIEIELRNADPELASVNPPAPLETGEMQALLDDESVLLQYAFAEQSSYVWIVTRDDVVAVELADREVIEAAARDVLEGFEHYSPASSARRAAAADLRELAELVLAPIREHLDRPRVVLSLDGALQYVPFAAMPIVSDDGAGSRLLEGHEVVRVPSMSALAALRRREATASTSKQLAVFADPVLERGDPRLEMAPPAAAANAARSVPVGPGATLDTDLQRLPSTAREAEAIAGLVAADERLVARGFDASRGAVLDSGLGDYRYVHFATHGLVNARYPGLSALVMSRFDPTGASTDGLLRLHDIYALDLNADLVVLSACETALGREVRGEGLLGLSQGFMYAGARSVVASLWQVPDRATAELMAKFYGFMLEDGLTPADALRRAQRALAADSRWSDPYFWGGFILLGDWQWQ